MIDRLIELLESLRAAGDIAQVATLATIVALIIIPLYWMQKSARLNVREQELKIAKQAEQIQEYKVTCRAYDEEIEQLQRLLIEYLLESIDKNGEELSESSVYVLCKDLIDRLTPAMDQACSSLAHAYSTDIPLSGDSIHLEKIRQAEIVNRLYGEHFDQITNLLQERIAGRAITNRARGKPANRVQALEMLALSRDTLYRE